MDHLLDDEDHPRHEREVTLSTGAILGIFLGLAVLCGGFFGFGYNMGRKSAPTPLSLSEVSPEAPLTSGSGNKPAAGTPFNDGSADTSTPTVVTRPAKRTPPPAATTDPGSEGEGDTPDTPAPKPAVSRTPPAPSTAAPIVRQPAPVPPSALSPSVAAPSSAVAGSGGTFMVQVAAVSHREDADLLLGALRSRGYAVSAHPGAADTFIHVQVGPFHDKKEADAMRQRLIADGYNAIVK